MHPNVLGSSQQTGFIEPSQRCIRLDTTNNCPLLSALRSFSVAHNYGLQQKARYGIKGNPQRPERLILRLIRGLDKHIRSRHSFIPRPIKQLRVVVMRWWDRWSELFCLSVWSDRWIGRMRLFVAIELKKTTIDDVRSRRSQSTIPKHWL